jgi:hypothetical protein
MSLDFDTTDIDAALAVLRQHAGDPARVAYVFDAILEFVRPYHSSMFWGDRMLLLDRSLEFLEDAAFRQAISTANSDTGMNQYASPNGIAWRFHTLVWAARQALRVPGDFVECGVYEGDMSWVLTEMVDLAATGRRLPSLIHLRVFRQNTRRKRISPTRRIFLVLRTRATSGRRFTRM